MKQPYLSHPRAPSGIRPEGALESVSWPTPELCRWEANLRETQKVAPRRSWAVRIQQAHVTAEVVDTWPLARRSLLT